MLSIIDAGCSKIILNCRCKTGWDKDVKVGDRFMMSQTPYFKPKVFFIMQWRRLFFTAGHFPIILQQYKSSIKWILEKWCDKKDKSYLQLERCYDGKIQINFTKIYGTCISDTLSNR